ncbi:MAG: AMP-binding protein [Desulfurococcaceae archaeon]
MHPYLRNIKIGERIIPPSLKWKTISVDEYRVIYEKSISNVVEFWSREARKLHWCREWRVALEGEPPNVKWFIDGCISPYYNVILKHKDTSIWNKIALIWEGEEEDVKTITYGDLDDMVERISSSLLNMGLDGFQWCIIYTPPLIESITLMLALTRLGVPFEPVFTGFGFRELASRAIRRRSETIVTVDGYYRRGREIDVLSNVRKAVEYAKRVKRIIVIERIGSRSFRENETSFDDLVGSTGVKGFHACVKSDHPLFGLHSGYEDDFKPITHGTGGFLVQVYSTTQWLGLRPRDTYYCTVWPGWITGISYVLFGPLMIGSTIVLYDGSLDYPSWSRFWSIIERYAVTILLTTSGALRTVYKKESDSVLKHNIDTLKAILVTAEPLEIDVWEWTYRVVGTGYTPMIESIPGKQTGRIPVVNMYIQSEIGSFVTGNLLNYTFPPIAPGSTGPPIPGFHVDIEYEFEINGFRIGRVVLRKPWPAMPIDYPEEFARAWSRGYYDTGDIGFMDRDGYLYVLGRADCVMKISGFRISPGAIDKYLEEALGKRVLTIGYPNELRFEAPLLFVDEEVDENRVKQLVRELLGPIADPKTVLKTPGLHKVNKNEVKKILKRSIWLEGKLDYSELIRIISNN